MSLDFTKDVANYLSLGINQIAALLSGATEISCHAWLQADTLTALQDNNRMVSIPRADGATGLEMATGAASQFRIGVRSTAVDPLVTKTTTTVIPTDGSWCPLGARMKFNDPSADYLFPYINGDSENGGSVAGAWAANTWVNGAHTNEPEGIGGFFPSTGPPPPDTNRQFDGRIAEVAFWTEDIGDAGLAQLADGASALLVRPESLVFYDRLINSPKDVISGILGTITGSIPAASHPRIYMPSRQQIEYAFRKRFVLVSS